MRCTLPVNTGACLSRRRVGTGVFTNQACASNRNHSESIIDSQWQRTAHYIMHSYYRMSMYSSARALFILRTAQNLPHILQVSEWSSSGIRLSRIALAVAGSSAQAYCASQSRTRLASAILSSISLAPGIPFAMSAA